MSCDMAYKGHNFISDVPASECVSLELTLGPKTTPPPGFRGVVLDPCRAFPVPFWAKGFLPPPLTSALVLVLALPCKQDSM